MANIEEVAFSKLVCGGKVYRAPVVVYPDRVDGRWWRKDGTVFSPEDFDAVIEAAPETVVLGVGFSAKVQVPEATLDRFREAGIECVVAETVDAVARFNELSRTRRVVGAFHLF